MKSVKAKGRRRCEYCSSPMKSKSVSVFRRRAKRHMLFEHVPALVCPTCGHRVFPADSVERMESALCSPARTRRRVSLLIVPKP